MSAAAGKAAGGAAKAVGAAAAKAGGAAAASAAGKGKFPTPRRDLASAMGFPSAAASLAAAQPLALGIAKEAEAFLSLRRTIPMAHDPATGLLTPGEALPDRPPTALAGRTLHKRLRLHPHWKLRPVRRWIDFAPFIKEIHIRFDPCVEGFAGSRELGRQARSQAVQTKYPSCAVKVQELDDGTLPMVVIKWVRFFGGGLGGLPPLLKRLRSLSHTSPSPSLTLCTP